MSRRLFRYDTESKQMVEVGADWSDTPRRAPVATEELTYGGMAATDGTLINTRKRHREYMKRNNLALAHEASGIWAQQAKEREQIQRGTHDSAERREAIGRALYERSKR